MRRGQDGIVGGIRLSKIYCSPRDIFVCSVLVVCMSYVCSCMRVWVGYAPPKKLASWARICTGTHVCFIHNTPSCFRSMDRSLFMEMERIIEYMGLHRAILCLFFGPLLDDGLKRWSPKALKGLPLSLPFCLCVCLSVNKLQVTVFDPAT